MWSATQCIPDFARIGDVLSELRCIPVPDTLLATAADRRTQHDVGRSVAYRADPAALYAGNRMYNMSGQPAMSMPLAWNAAGLPLGMMFAARFGDEATLFRLAAQLEQERPWKDRLPPFAHRSTKLSRIRGRGMEFGANSGAPASCVSRISGGRNFEQKRPDDNVLAPLRASSIKRLTIGAGKARLRKSGRPEMVEAGGYQKVGPAHCRDPFQMDGPREAHNEYFVDETIGENSAPVVTGPLTGDAAIRFVDDREREARERFEQLKNEMAGRGAAAKLSAKTPAKCSRYSARLESEPVRILLPPEHRLSQKLTRVRS